MKSNKSWLNVLGGSPLTRFLGELGKIPNFIVSLWVDVARMVPGVDIFFIAIILRREKDLIVSYVKLSGSLPLFFDYLNFIIDIICDMLMLAGFFIYLTRKELSKQNKK